MDIEKLIEQLRTESLYADKASLEIMDLCMEASTSLSTLQAENEKLRADVVRFNDMLASYQNVLVPELRAELEQVKAERDAALEHLHGICSACKNNSHYHNRGKCRFCMYELDKEIDVEVNDNWEWSGPKED